MGDLTALPKAHLHVHLESSVRWSTLRELAAANGMPVPAEPGPEGLRFNDFRAFADLGTAIRACLVTADDFRRVAREFCHDAAADGVGYAEITVTAAAHGDRLGDPAMPIDAVIDGLAEGARAGLSTAVILDHSRRRPVERFARTVDLAARRPQVVAVGLAGDERYPLRPFVSECLRAHDLGLGLVHHAGELAGPGSIRDAVELGRADRIGHGITVLEDPALTAELAARGLGVEVCPTSNLSLGLVPGWDRHPLPDMRAGGLAVSLNTDIPNVLGSPPLALSAEYERAMTTFGWTDEIMAEIARTSVLTSFAPPDVAGPLLAGIERWLTWRAGEAGDSSGCPT